MAEITASMVKDLREQTGVGMMDAKNALSENNGDMNTAIDWLRKKGLAKAAKKSGRTAAEGLVAIAVEGKRGVVIEVNSETDFVARNEEFQSFVRKAAQIALGAKDLEDLKTKAFGGGKTVADALTDLIAKIGENMTLRRFGAVEVANGMVAGYMHSALADGLGKIGVLVGLETTGNADSIKDNARQLAMHVAAASPEYLAITDIKPEALERERAVLKEKHLQSGKPADKVDAIVEGDLRKNYYGQICLLEQPFIIDGKTRVADVVSQSEKTAGAPVKLSGFVRFQLGDGIEKEAEDFAAEVAKVANG